MMMTMMMMMMMTMVTTMMMMMTTIKMNVARPHKRDANDDGKLPCR